MILDFYARQKAARALCAQSGLTLIYEHEAKSPRTDGKKVYVPYPSPSWTQDQLTMWEGNLYHEIGHNDPEMRDVFELNDKLKISMDSFIGQTWNLLDDARQEYHKHDEYYGKQQIMSKSSALHVNQILAQNVLGNSGDRERDALEAILAWDTKHRETWQRDMIGLSERIVDQLSDQGREFYEKLEATGDELLTYGLTAEEEYEKVKQLLEILDFDAQAEEKAGQDQAKAAAGGEGGEEADGSGSSGEGGEGKGKGLLRHEHGDDGQGKEGEAYGFGGGAEDVGERNDSTDTPWKSPMEFDYVPPEGAYIPTPEDKIRVRDFSKDATCVKKKRDHVEQDLLAMPSSSGLASQTRRLLQVYSQSFYQHGLKQGRLGKNLHRATMGQTGGYSQRVFKKKIENNMLDTAVEVLVDCSGSMGGEKFEHAGHSAILLNESVSKIGVPIEITGFTEDDDGAEHFVFKGFGERVTREDLADRFARVSTKLWQNADGESILWAYNRLMKQKAKRKLLIVLSDGWPAACNRTGDIDEFTKEVCQSIDKSPAVEMYGIGIMSDAVRNFYRDWTVINDSAELENALLNVIKKKILNK